MARKDLFLEQVRYKPSAGTQVFEPERNTGFAFPVFDAAPTPGAGFRGMPYILEGASGAADSAAIVLKDADDAYVALPLDLNRRRILSGEANLTLGASQSGALILMDDATQAFVLPAITAGEVGIYYDFNSTVAATTTTITAGAADLLTGGVFIATASVPGGDHFQPDVSDDLIITMNGTTTGGMIGTWLRLTAISTTRWLVQGVMLGSGTTLTPFS